MFNLLAQAGELGFESTSTPTTNGMDSIVLIPVLLLVVLVIAGLWKVFTKAGRPGWAAIIPIYNLVVMLQIANLPLWWLAVIILGSLIPFVGALIALGAQIYIGIKLGEKFGKSPVWGAILLGIFSGIGYLILGFGSAQYQGSDGQADGFGQMPAGAGAQAPQAPTTEGVVQAPQSPTSDGLVQPSPTPQTPTAEEQQPPTVPPTTTV